MYTNPYSEHTVIYDPMKSQQRDCARPENTAADETGSSPALSASRISAEEMELARRFREELESEIKVNNIIKSSRAQHPQREVSDQRGRSGIFGREPKEIAKAPWDRVEGLISGVCYDNATGKFWKKTPDNAWIQVDKSSLTRHLAAQGIAVRRGEDEDLSQADEFINRVQNERYIHMCADIGGYRKGIHRFGDMRILVPSEPTFITPVKGSWKMLGTVLMNMFGKEQLRYVCYWIKVALEMFEQQSWMAGQILVLCGEPESGKTLFTSLLRHLFGGRLPGKPFSHMTLATDFNSDFMGKELLTIEDEVSLTSYKARQDFGAKLKDLAVNDFKRLHRKGVEAATVMPMQRLVITLNDEPERMQVLPPLNADIEDKMMLIKVFKQKMPMPTTTPAERKAFSDALVAQLPAFLYDLKQKDIPSDLVCDRFGVRHYHHPDLVASVQQQSPEEHLLNLIDEVFFSRGKAMVPWDGQ